MSIKLKEVLKKQFGFRKVSLNAVAKECRIPISTLHGWVQGTPPSAKNLHLIKNLAKYFQISVNEILFNETDDKRQAVTVFSTTFNDEDVCYRIVIEKVKRL